MNPSQALALARSRWGPLTRRPDGAWQVRYEHVCHTYLEVGQHNELRHRISYFVGKEALRLLGIDTATEHRAMDRVHEILWEPGRLYRRVADALAFYERWEAQDRIDNEGREE